MSGIPHDVGGTGLTDMLAMIGAGQSITSESSTCASQEYTITFKEKGGDHPEIMVSCSIVMIFINFTNIYN